MKRRGFLKLCGAALASVCGLSLFVGKQPSEHDIMTEKLLNNFYKKNRLYGPPATFNNKDFGTIAIKSRQLGFNRMRTAHIKALSKSIAEKHDRAIFEALS